MKKFMTIFKGYFYNIYTAFAINFIAGVMRTEYQVPVEFGVTRRRHNPLFWITSVYLLVSNTHGAEIAVIMDALPAGCYCGIIMRIMVLQEYVKAIGTSVDFNHVLKDRMHRERVKTAVVEYLKICQFKRKAEKAFN